MHVALAETPGVTGASAYEVILGTNDNTMSRILKNMETNEVGAEAETANVLDCNSYKVRALS